MRATWSEAGSQRAGRGRRRRRGRPGAAQDVEKWRKIPDHAGARGGRVRCERQWRVATRKKKLPSQGGGGVYYSGWVAVWQMRF
jgi:hypothetical protein